MCIKAKINVAKYINIHSLQLTRVYSFVTYIYIVINIQKVTSVYAVFLVLANKQTLVKTLVWKIYIMKGNVCVQRANTHLCCFYFLPYSIFIYHLFIFINIHYYPCSCNACSCGLIFWLCLHKLQIRRNRFHGRLWSSLVTFVLVRRTQTKHRERCKWEFNKLCSLF